MSVVILMYHRVCERADARPWFARGTAVTPSAFGRQMRWLVGHFDVVPLRELLFTCRRAGGERVWRRPLAALTFDDGYADVAHNVLPVCRELGMVGTVFPVCGHLADDGRRLWFDSFYELLEASIPPSLADEDPPLGGVPLSHWVRGVEKEALQSASAEARPSMLRELAKRLGVQTSIEHELYLSTAALTDLVRQGWSVGGHGVTHSRLPSLDDARASEEIAHSVSFASTFDSAEVVFAYPDGKHDPRVRALAAAAGVKWALTVSPGPVSHSAPLDHLAVPRYLCCGESEIPNPGLAELA